MNANPNRQPIGQVLIARGVISEDQLRIALLEQMKSNLPVGKLLVSLGFVSEATLRDALGESLGQKSIDLSRATVDPAALQLIPKDVAKRHHLLPLDYAAELRRLTVAIADHNDIVALDKLRALASPDLLIDTVLAGESEIARAIDQYYGHELSIDGILHEIETGEIDWRSLAATSDEYSQPVVRLIDGPLERPLVLVVPTGLGPAAQVRADDRRVFAGGLVEPLGFPELVLADEGLLAVDRRQVVQHLAGFRSHFGISGLDRPQGQRRSGKERQDEPNDDGPSNVTSGTFHENRLLLSKLARFRLLHQHMVSSVE